MTRPKSRTLRREAAARARRSLALYVTLMDARITDPDVWNDRRVAALRAAARAIEVALEAECED